MPQTTRPQVYRVVREMLPRERFGPFELLRWLEETQERNEGASRSHAKRRPSRLAARPSLNRRCNTSNLLLDPNPPKGSSRADRTGDERREQAEVRV